MQPGQKRIASVSRKKKAVDFGKSTTAPISIAMEIPQTHDHSACEVAIFSPAYRSGQA
jgi:hypothetical protein